MSQTKVKKLTPAQADLIPVYREKWWSIALATGPIDRSKVTATIETAYGAIGKKAPDIIFVDRPYQAADIIVSYADKPRSCLRNELETKLRSDLEKQLRNCLRGQIENQLENQLYDRLQDRLYTALQNQLWSPLRGDLAGKIGSRLQEDLREQRNRNLLDLNLNRQLDNCIQTELWACSGSWLDYCISVLNCAHSCGNMWNIFQSIARYCGWIYPYDKVCVVCEKPIALMTNSEYQLHAAGKPAVEFADGYAIYAYRGVILPQWYGCFHPHEWQSQWLLKEQNAEVRRALIQGIGYDRIIQELEATELDKWREYTLLKIDFQDDFDESGQPLPVILLKMTCPSTGFIHALRVPPNLTSAREAIRWVNWGIEPGEFSMQT
ncbi:MAG: hypothetical protein MUE44_10900 [Oscillatoriaceae cyanobacterium Prado104]|jgi:hypothetical protein|nr:hypothetical protein [Oscillatoriaceae cyanobacterium Prado104]